METRVLKIDKKELINWYLDDSDDGFYMMRRIKDDLLDDKIFTFKIADIFELAGYLPIHLIINKEDIYDSDLKAFEIQQIDAYDYELV